MFLLLATVAIVAGGILGLQYLNQHDAKPEIVNKKVELSTSSFAPPQSAASATTNAAVDRISANADPLLDEFIQMIDRVGKETMPDCSANRPKVVEFFHEFERDPALGRRFIQQLNQVFPKTVQRPEVLAFFKRDLGEGFISAIGHFKSEYKRQQDEISSAQARAENAAALKRSEAMSSHYTAGVLFIVFVGLILLTVLLKIERNLRSLQLSQASAEQ